jgi:methionyl-tRNA formyltransferase
VKQLRIALFADPPIGTWALSEFYKAGIQICSAVSVLPRTTRPDPVDEMEKRAQSWNIPFFRTISLSLNEFKSEFKKTKPDLIVCVSFLRKIPDEVLQLAALGGVNCHPALLPKYRGSVPYFWAIYRQEKTSGITLHKMIHEYDAGEIFLQKELPIEPEDTTGTLAFKCFALGIKLLIQFIQNLKNEPLPPSIPQDHSKVTYAPMPDASILKINWNKPSKEILALIRAGSPFWGAYTLFRSLPLKIWSARISQPNSKNIKPGTLIISNGRTEVAASDFFISLESLQLEMLRFYSGSEFSTLSTLKDGESLE